MDYLISGVPIWKDIHREKNMAFYLYLTALRKINSRSVKALHVKSIILKHRRRASLVGQWLRVCLPMHGTWVHALVQKDPTCSRATKPVCYNYWACTLEPVSHNYWNPSATTTEACVPRAHAPKQEKSLQWETCAPQQRVAPACCK